MSVWEWAGLGFLALIVVDVIVSLHTTGEWVPIRITLERKGRE